LDNVRVDKSVLDNGLRVLTVGLPHLHAGLINVYVRAGSRHEDARNNGVSHFLEHLFFRGSQGFPDGRLMNALVEDVGGDLNGVTARDHGYYTSPFHPARLELPMQVLGDLLARPLLKEMELEREVILEEILDEVDEDGRDIDVDNLSKRAIFGEHPLSLKIAGTRDSVAGLTHEDVVEQHARAYGAKNLVVVCGGPLEHRKVVEMAQQAFRHLVPGRALDDGPAPAAILRSAPELVMIDHKGESQTQVQLSFAGPHEEHPDFAALRIIRRILGDGLSSRLQGELVEKRALAYSVGAGADPFTDCSVFDVGAACAPRKAPQVAEALLELLGELCEKEVPEGELLRAKSKSRIRVEFMQDSPGEMVEWYGLDELLRGRLENPIDWLNRMEDVSAQELMRVARRTFKRNRLVACVVGPLAGVEKKLTAILDKAQGLPE
jgi:predicted Zn-dependent peptidase